MNIQLKSFTDGDMPLFIQWLSCDYIKKWYAPIEDWIDEVSKRKEEYCWIKHYIIFFNEIPIGFCQYYPYWKSGENWNGSIATNETYSVDYFIGNTDYLRKGCACEALKRLNSIILSLPDGKRIIAQPDSENRASQKTLLSAGYCYDEENHLFILEK